MCGERGVYGTLYFVLILAVNLKLLSRDFPGGPVGKTLSSRFRGPGFNPWSGN